MAVNGYKEGMECPLCSQMQSEKLPVPKDNRIYLKCAICEFVWLDPSLRMPLFAEKERYLSHNNSLDIPDYLNYLQRLAQPVMRQICPGARGLDFGCGPVEGLKKLMEAQDFEVHSYDPIFFPRPNALEMQYDFVFCCEVVEHFFDPLQEFQRINTLLKPEGILGISSRLLPPLEEFANWSYRRDKTHVCFFTEKTVAWIANKFGWEILTLESPIWILKKL